MKVPKNKKLSDRLNFDDKIERRMIVKIKRLCIFLNLSLEK